jgi:hypothetical protein
MPCCTLEAKSEMNTWKLDRILPNFRFALGYRLGISERGQVAEWFKAAVLKTAVDESLPWVRIPPCPPFFLYKNK